MVSLLGPSGSLDVYDRFASNLLQHFQSQRPQSRTVRQNNEMEAEKLEGVYFIVYVIDYKM